MAYETELDKEITNFKANHDLLVVPPAKSVWGAVFLTAPYAAGSV